MIKITAGRVPVFMSKFFSAHAVEECLAALEAAKARRVLFVDTGATPHLAAAIRSLVEEGVEVHVRDHHRGEGRTPEAAEEIESLIGGERARIVSREEAPGCALLVERGEFAGEGTAIVADPDLDGLVASAKAAGTVYDGLDADAEVFDVRPRQSAETLTALGWTVVRALSTLPAFNPKRPEVAENAKKELFESFLAAAQGDAEAKASLEAKVEAYECAVAAARRLLAEKISHPCKGVVMVDAVGAGRPDLNTLTRGMEKVGAIVTVVRKDVGPIAGKPGGHGVQLSCAVVRKHQAELDLRDLVPEGAESSPQAGLLSNVAFLLHCSEEVWRETILPALEARLG